LSPQNKHKVAFVRGNDIFVHNITQPEPGQEHTAELQVTSDGNMAIRNGVHNGVYEEELYGAEFAAMWWSPSGDKLAFIRSDESNVSIFVLLLNSPPHLLVFNETCYRLIFFTCNQDMIGFFIFEDI